jgi:hypothetical protein
MLGDTLEFILTLADGREFITRQPRRGAENLPPGTEVWAYWEPAFFTLYPFEDVHGKPGTTGAG